MLLYKTGVTQMCTGSRGLSVSPFYTSRYIYLTGMESLPWRR